MVIRGGLLSRGCRILSTGLPVANVTVNDLVGLALLAELAGGLDGSLGSVLLEVLVRHDLTTDELVLKVRVDDTSSSGGLGTLADGPGADLIGTTGEVTDELERSVTRGGDTAESRRRLLAEAESLTLGNLLLLRHHNEALLKSDREGDEKVSGVVLVDPGLDLREPLVLFAEEVALRKVDEVGDGLGGKEGKTVDDLDLKRVSYSVSDNLTENSVGLG